MAHATAVWELPATPDAKSSPKILTDGKIAIEAFLEDWIVANPDLLEPGLAVLGRQLQTDGGTLDLLALDRGGRLVVIELKRDTAYRAALAQLLDYASCLAALGLDELRANIDANRKAQALSGTFDEVLAKHLGPEAASAWANDEEPPRLLVVGTGGDASLKRIIDYLVGRYDVPVNGVFMDVFTSTNGTLLVRSAVLTDDEARRQGQRGRGRITDEELLSLADARKTEAFVKIVLAAWEKATSRKGRPERAERCWSLAKKSDGRQVSAWLYPWDDDDSKAIAWLRFDADKLAGDCSKTAEKVTTELSTAVAAQSDWIPIATEQDATKIADAIKKLYT